MSTLKKNLTFWKLFGRRSRLALNDGRRQRGYADPMMHPDIMALGEREKGDLPISPFPLANGGMRTASSYS